MMFRILALASLLVSMIGGVVVAEDITGTAYIDNFGYKGCIELKNNKTRVVLGHHAGGRVLEYSINGKNAIWLNPKEAGRITDPAKGTRGGSSGGRFDIGPEYVIPKHPVLWNGNWSAKITGARSARLTSQKDNATGVQLVRDFQLDEKTSKLQITQIIKNASEKTTEWCHWSRTFALGKGIAVVPISNQSRFPNKYIQVESRHVINVAPKDPNIHVSNSHIVISGPPKFPKLGFDSYDGWFAYLMPNNTMFVKAYPTYPDRVYNEIAGLTLSIWYPDRKDLPVVELEPIGPREKLKPGESASFTETWYLMEQEFPQKHPEVNIEELTKKIREETDLELK